MRLDRVCILLLACMGTAPRVGAEAPAFKKYQVITPKDDRIGVAAINATGDVAGAEWAESKENPDIIGEMPFFARGGQMTAIPLLNGYTATFPAALSDDGLVVGRASKPGSPTKRVMLRNQAFVWDAKSGIRGLGALEGEFASVACGISRDGKTISGYSIGDNRMRACVWDRVGDAWKGTALPHVDRLASNVVAISDDGRLVSAVDGVVPCLWSRDGAKWTREVIGGAGDLVPRAVNNSGVVVGLKFGGDGRKHAAIRTREAGCRAIEEPVGFIQSEANDVNNDGAVVGSVEKQHGHEMDPRAFLYLGGRFGLIDAGGPNFIAGTAINDRWQISGTFERDDEEVK